MPEAVKYGALTEEEVDKHVIRLLEGRFDLGEMDDNKIVSWSKIPVSVLCSKAHRQLSLDMALQTMTLLQNKNEVLPLDKKVKKIAFISEICTISREDIRRHRIRRGKKQQHRCKKLLLELSHKFFELS